jgi:PqqD family protein of HPr-rel-A system
MISEHSTLTPADNALVQKVGDEMVILDAQSGQYYTLNEMATEILEQFTSGSTLQAVVAYVCKEYDVSQSEAQTDIQSMLSTLLEKELVLLAE